MYHQGFELALTDDLAEELRGRADRARGTVLTATSVAGSGHPGGSFSSMEMYTLLFGCARLRPAQPRWSERDRVVISHGHTSPGVYSAMAEAGFFPPEEVEAHFRQAGCVFEGHVERSVPGVEWSTGNLGQGLSAGVGMALGARLTGRDYHTFVAMSDGEQHKGQVAEARRLAVKERLSDITAVVDLNGIQISGKTSDVMPVQVADDFAADGWRVIEVDGHDIEALHAAISAAVTDRSAPVAVIARTVIGKGVSFMEGEPEFHGRGLNSDEYAKAMAELGLEPRLDAAMARRHEPVRVIEIDHCVEAVEVDPGEPRTYDADSTTDNRSAWGHALVDLAEANPDTPIAVIDCDLAVSVKTKDYWDAHPDRFVQAGVGEHNAATIGGALSASDVLTFFSDFGVFGCDETYNQQRLNDINGAALKLSLTHCGIDVGEDGKTHQCLDYIGAFREFFGWKVIVPGDPNQTDRAVRAAAALDGCVALAMGRSKLPCIKDLNGEPLFAGEYSFEYGSIEWAREGADATILVTGTVCGAAVDAADALRDEGVDVAVGIVACPLHLDEEAMHVASSSPVVLTVEDHNVRTGLGASVAEWLALAGIAVNFARLGIEGYQPSGASGDLMERAGLSSSGIKSAVRGLLES